MHSVKNFNFPSMDKKLFCFPYYAFEESSKCNEILKNRRKQKITTNFFFERNYLKCGKKYFIPFLNSPLAVKKCFISVLNYNSNCPIFILFNVKFQRFATLYFRNTNLLVKLILNWVKKLSLMIHIICRAQ